jgi:cyclic-di-AMP phosphodiesterase PgpH
MPQSRPATRRSVRRRSSTRDGLRLVLLGAVLAGGLWLIMAFRLPSDPDIQVDQPSPVTLKSPRSTTFVSEVLTEQARERVAANEGNQVYKLDRSLPIQQRDLQDAVLQQIERARLDRSSSAAERVDRVLGTAGPQVGLSLEQAQALVALSDEEWQTVAAQARRLYGRAIADNNYSLDASAIDRVRDLFLPFNMPPGLSGTQQELITTLVMGFLVPNRALDEEATAARQDAARQAVQPVPVRVLKDELLVQEGALVTPADMEKLQALGLISARAGGPRLIGYGLLALLIGAIFSAYLYYFQPDIWPAVRPMLVIVGLMLATAAAAKLLLPTWRAAPYAFPLAAAAMLLGVLFNSHLAIVVTLLLAVVLGVLGDQLFDLTVVACFGGLAGIFCVRKLERSTTYLFGGLVVATVTFLAQAAFWLNGFTLPRPDDLAPLAIFSAINGGLSAILALGLTNPLGRAAGRVTPLQLLELAHPTQPLLRRLMREAPGTYYHSINVSNLAEAAAEAIGADALLLRVGAYYHDIGKMIRPYFFTDNQIDRPNVHDELDPETSVAIIIDHVREGVKMATQASLPAQIVDFIRTHHGTSVAGHFYQLALQREDSVDIAEYTYPGPKPWTTEQAILLLADSVEATVRSKAQSGKLRIHRPGDEPEARARHDESQSLDELLNQILDSRVRGGQLDDSPLTMRDLALIKAAFLNTLQGIYHPRVEYNVPATSKVPV